MAQLSTVPALDLLHDVGSLIASADPLRDVLHEVVELVSEVVSCDSCFIWVREDDELVLRASKNAHPEVLGEIRLGVGQGITGWVAEHEEAVVISDRAFDDPRFAKFLNLPEDEYEAFLSTPVVFRDKVVAVINVQHRERRDHSPREVKAIAGVGHLVGAGIEIARLEARVGELSDRLETRKVVERAKGILQRDMNITEDVAYGFLHKTARQRRKPMREIAAAIILADDLKRGAEPL